MIDFSVKSSYLSETYAVAGVGASLQLSEALSFSFDDLLLSHPKPKLPSNTNCCTLDPPPDQATPWPVSLLTKKDKARLIT